MKALHWLQLVQHEQLAKSIAEILNCSSQWLCRMSFNRWKTVFNAFNFSLTRLQIYTDWANYYLERAKSKRKVTDLSADCRDGLLLAEVIEAVTSFKVPDLVKKPKNQQQMVSQKNYIVHMKYFRKFKIEFYPSLIRHK